MKKKLMKLMAASIAGLLLLAACGDSTPSTDDRAPDSSSVSVESNQSSGATGAVPERVDGSEAASGSSLAVLPTREGPRRETTGSVPHIQTDAVLVPEVDAELRRRVFLLPGVEDRETEISLPGARGLWLGDDLELARPEVLDAGREFAHIHPDGSLHVWMPVDRAVEAEAAKWGELHPWVKRSGFWDGVVMIYTPETQAEVDVVVQLVVDAYNYIVGTELNANSFG